MPNLYLCKAVSNDDRDAFASHARNRLESDRDDRCQDSRRHSPSVASAATTARLLLPDLDKSKQKRADPPRPVGRVPVVRGCSSLESAIGAELTRSWPVAVLGETPAPGAIAAIVVAAVVLRRVPCLPRGRKAGAAGSPVAACCASRATARGDAGSDPSVSHACRSVAVVTHTDERSHSSRTSDSRAWPTERVDSIQLRPDHIGFGPGGVGRSASATPVRPSPASSTSKPSLRSAVE
jgi:hypothetical protein